MHLRRKQTGCHQQELRWERKGKKSTDPTSNTERLRGPRRSPSWGSRGLSVSHASSPGATSTVPVAWHGGMEEAA